MLRSLYRTLLSYTLFRRYFGTLFFTLLTLVILLEMSLFYSDLFALLEHPKKETLIYFFSLKWIIITAVTVTFFLLFYRWRPQKSTPTPPTVEEKKSDPKLTRATEEKLQRLLHKEKLENRAEKLLKKR